MIDQPSLFDDERLSDRAHARRGDPETSVAAAASISPAKLRESQAAVLRLYDGGVRLYDDALLDLYQHEVDRRTAPPQSPSGLRTRRRELVDLGLLRDSNVRQMLPTGRSSILWERTPRQEES